jgi:putative peptidoglycan lipid II flippase
LQRFAAAAAAPILLNLSLIVALMLVAFFPTAGHAAAWGVFVAGCLEALLVAGDTTRAGALPRFRKIVLDEDVRKFFRALGPAVIGSGGVQLALFADTIIASFLPVGSLSALYYADRINQLPIGVIGIAAGTVVLPEMARRLAIGDQHGALHAQNRAIEFTLLLALPCVAAFAIVPDVIIRGLFMRGAFSAADAQAAANTLAAYALGLLPFVLIRSVVAAFYARGDTATPVKAALIGVAVNIVFKLLLMGPLAQVGLALATSIGAWVNLLLVLWFARRAELGGTDQRLRVTGARLAVATIILAGALWVARGPIIAAAQGWPLPDEAALGALALLGAVVYGSCLFVMLGMKFLDGLRQSPRD